MDTKDLIEELHPGRTILEEVLKPLGLSVNALAKELHIPTTRLNDIVRRRRGVTADTALRFARYLGTSPQFWLNLRLWRRLVLPLRVVEGGVFRRAAERHLGTRRCP